MANNDRFVDISILGDRELQQKLKRLETQIQRKIVRAENRKAMKPVKDRAQALAPVKTGRLKESIKQMSRTRRGISRAMVVTGQREDLGIDPNAKFYYPAALEYGYVKNGKRYPAKSFLRRAITELRSSVIKAVASGIGRAIDREAKK